MLKNILYIHGFNSSPLSVKAVQTRDYLAKNHPEIAFHCPQLATSPTEAMAQLEQIIEQEGEMNTWSFIGSSLGGYFASHLAEKYQQLAVMINPAIRPFELLEDYIGQQENPYTGIVYQVTKAHMTQLKAMEPVTPKLDSRQKNNYLVMVQTGDEVLDYQQAVEKYQHCRLIIEEGGDHSFINFAKRLPMIADFLLLKAKL
ncbi:MAG: esterase YqiA [Colwellia sp.]|nr:esterase YqiA [Colwellia sp.]MCW8863369.1 esterase YqiA [Colwellia sp.]MCW9080028.1 esterase YqiA [Colwellia sp.]